MDRYAFHLIAMSMEEAKKTLGLDPNATPSPDEVKEAHRKKVFELHPDRGGAHEDMVEVNVAKDILEGKARPSYSRSPSSPSHEPSAPSGGHWSPPKKREVTFQEAESKASIPSGVEWLFVTPSQRGTSWQSDESSQQDSSWVAYGRTSNQHVFVGARNFSKQSFYVGGGADDNIWTIRSFEFPIRTDEGQNPAWLYGNVGKALKAVGFEGKFNSKVMDAKGWAFSSRTPSTSTTSIKHWLVGSGQVSGDAPSVAGRKQVVEFTFNKSYEHKPGYVPAPTSRSNTWDGKYHGDYYMMAVILNGRKYELTDDETTKILGLKAGGKTFLDLMFGRYQYGGEKKNVTRMPKGKMIISWFAENLKSLPPDAIDVLKAATEQMKG
jgi:hypothetical protein